MENKKAAPLCETGAAERIARISADLAFNRREMLAESKRKLQELLQAEHPFGQGRMVTVSFPQHKSWPDICAAHRRKPHGQPLPS